MNILVTGGAGFAGTGLVKRFLEKGHEVTVLDITPKPHSTLHNIESDSLTYLWKSVHDVTAQDVEGNDIIVHLAAQADVPMSFVSPGWTAYQNIDGLLRLLEICRHISIEKFILASSGNVFGRYEYLPIDEKHQYMPHNPYAFSKASQELAAMSYYRCYNIPVTILSTGIVAGPGMRKEVFLYKWLWNILNDKPTVLEGGDQTRDVTYISDTIDAFELAINAPPAKTCGEKFMISKSEEYTVSNILGMCYDVIGAKRNIIHRGYRPGEEGQREYFDNTRAKEILWYTPKVSIRETIQSVTNWIERGLSK